MVRPHVAVARGPPYDSRVIRAATVDDAAELARLFTPHREALARWSPVFWRPAESAEALHTLFLGWLIDQGGGVGFVAPGRGAVVARPHDGALLVDDLVADDGALAADLVGAVASLIRPQPAGSNRAGSTPVAGWPVAPDGSTELRGVAAIADERGTAALVANGLVADTTWWVAPVRSDAAGPADGGPADGGPAAFTVVASPPVYAPGGPVAMVGAGPVPADLAELVGAAAGAGCVLAVVAALVTDVAGSARLASAGFEPTSRWYGRRGGHDLE